MNGAAPEAGVPTRDRRRGCGRGRGGTRGGARTQWCAYSGGKRELPDTAIDVQRDAEEQRVWKEFTKELA